MNGELGLNGCRVVHLSPQFLEDGVDAGVCRIPGLLLPPPMPACWGGGGGGFIPPPTPGGAGGMYPAVRASPCGCVMTPAGGGLNWFSKSAIASMSSNVNPFTAVGRASPPPLLPPPLDIPRKLLNMTDLFVSIFLGGRKKMCLLALPQPRKIRVDLIWIVDRRDARGTGRGA